MKKKNNPMKQFFDEKLYTKIQMILLHLLMLTNFKDFMIDNNYSIKSIPREKI